MPEQREHCVLPRVAPTYYIFLSTYMREAHSSIKWANKQLGEDCEDESGAQSVSALTNFSSFLSLLMQIALLIYDYFFNLILQYTNTALLGTLLCNCGKSPVYGRDVINEIQ